GQIQADNKVPIPGTPPVHGREILRSTGDVIGPARASAVSAADPANSNAIARLSVTLRFSFLLRFPGCAPLGSAETAHFTELVLLGHANIADCPYRLNSISKPLRAEVISSRV